MKFQNIATLPEEEQKELESAKWKLWRGLAKDCFDKLTVVTTKIDDKKA